MKFCYTAPMSSIDIAAGAQAFGDGTHPTTAGVLAALEEIDPAQFQPRIACDMGAGSGILAMAVARQFACPVVAVELERAAVQTLRENAAENGLGDAITALHADGFDHPDITARGPYDLMTMNILAEPLLRLAREAERHMAAEGLLILSGMLRWQEEQIRLAYQSLGLELAARVQLGDWVTLCFQKPDNS